MENLSAGRGFSFRWRTAGILLLLLTAPRGFAEQSPSDEVTLACVNFHAAWGDKAENLRRIKQAIRAAARDGANIILFPELALTGYQSDPSRPMHRELAETIPGPSTKAIAGLTRELGVYVVVGLPEKAPDPSVTVFNSAAVIGPRGIIGAYAKLMPFGDEMRWCGKGRNPLLFDSPWGPIGVGICYDSYMFPELPRYYAAMGARLYLHITALGAFPGWGEYYSNQLKARAIENMMCVASANLKGKDLSVVFPGAGMIVAPGAALHLIDVTGGPDLKEPQEILIAEVDLGRADKMRERYPLFQSNKVSGTPDWRPRLFSRLLKRIEDAASPENAGEKKRDQPRTDGRVEIP